MEYNIRLEYKLPPDEKHGDMLVTALESFSPAAGPVGNGNLDVWITVQAADARQAIDLGRALSVTASDAELLGFEVIPTAEFDRQQGMTPVPELIGSDEAAEMLGITRQAISKKAAKGELNGHRVGERTIVFARHDVEVAASKRPAKAAQ